MDHSRTRTEPRIRHTHQQHHSRNCAEPSSVPPWIFLVASLPLFMVVFSQVIYPVMSSVILGSNVENPGVYHMVQDTWTKLTSPCPVLVSSRTRERIRETLHDPTEIFSFEDFHKGSNTPLAIYNTEVFLDLRQHLTSNDVLQGFDNKRCSMVYNYFTQTIVSQDAITSRLRSSHVTGSECLGGIINCGIPILPNDIVTGIQKTVGLLTVRGYVMISKMSSLVPAIVHTVGSGEVMVYIQLLGSSVIYCRDSDTSTTWAKLDPGDGVVITDVCHYAYIESLDDVSLSLLASLPDKT